MSPDPNVSVHLIIGVDVLGPEQAHLESLIQKNTMM